MDLRSHHFLTSNTATYCATKYSFVIFAYPDKVFTLVSPRFLYYTSIIELYLYLLMVLYLISIEVFLSRCRMDDGSGIINLSSLSNDPSTAEYLACGEDNSYSCYDDCKPQDDWPGYDCGRDFNYLFRPCSSFEFGDFKDLAVSKALSNQHFH